MFIQQVIRPNILLISVISIFDQHNDSAIHPTTDSVIYLANHPSIKPFIHQAIHSSSRPSFIFCLYVYVAISSNQTVNHQSDRSCYTATWPSIQPIIHSTLHLFSHSFNQSAFESISHSLICPITQPSICSPKFPTKLSIKF